MGDGGINLIALKVIFRPVWTILTYIIIILFGGAAEVLPYFLPLGDHNTVLKD